MSNMEETITYPVKVYKKRWMILLVYILYSAANSFQWMEYSIIANIVMKFYQVNATDVDWTSIIYMLIYPIIVVPVSYYIEKKGLRFAALWGGLGTALAALIKVFSVRKNLFPLVLLGQAVGSTAQVFVLSLPSKIAAVWFKPSEVSTACSLAVFGTQVGFALGFVVPSSIVGNSEDPNVIARDLSILCQVITYYMIPVVVLIIFCFPKEPPLPPSIAQWDERKKEQLDMRQYLKAYKKLFHNRGFVFHTIAYGINIGVFAAIGTLLNQFILEYFPNSEEDAGRIGLIMVSGGILGSIFFGVVLDKTHKYKETTMFVYFAAVLSLIVTMFTLSTRSKPLVYIIFALVGVFTNAYMPVGFEFAVEITYPADESTTTGILNAMTQALGVLITLFLGPFNSNVGAFWSLGSQAALLLLGAVLTCFVPNKKLRQEAYSKDQGTEDELETLKQPSNTN
ncbi:choline/ethanolamine transporter flvcr2a-like [Rhynchophorus ferrugineus]|uniref:choline/ethanolamine transporter flvcr2a-like n=1 Tax=Rhynchophorus ferrugineus TaxID=354439 RepID=UPI003FCE21CD